MTSALIVPVLVFYAFRYYVLLATQGAYEARVARYGEGGIFFGSIDWLLFESIITPIVAAASIVLAFLIATKQLRKRTFFALAVPTGLFAFIGSGRIFMFKLAVALVFATILVRVVRGRSAESLGARTSDAKPAISPHLYGVPARSGRPPIAFAVIAIPLLVLAAAWTTAQRATDSAGMSGSVGDGITELFRTLVVYFTGSFRALDYGLDAFASQSGFLGGRGVLGGLDQIVATASIGLGIGGYKSSNTQVADLLQYNFIDIGANDYFNYAYTYLMTFFFDFGVAGIVLLPMVYGFVVRVVVNAYELRPTLPAFVAVVFLYQSLFMSVFRYEFSSLGATFLLGTCFILHRRTPKRAPASTGQPTMTRSRPWARPLRSSQSAAHFDSVS